MKMTSINSIDNEEELLESLRFLQNAFGWSNKKTLKIKNALISNNKSLNKFGYTIKSEDNKVVGSILIFYQGFLYLKKSKVPIINISSIYVDKKLRGLFSLKMIKKIINENKSCLITNLTTNMVAYKILKSFGFIDGNFANTKDTFFSLIFSLKLFDLRKMKEIFFNAISMSGRKPRNFNLGNAKCLKLQIGKSSLDLVIKNTNWERKVFFFWIRIRGIRILWTSNTKLFEKYSCQIMLLYLLKNYAFFVTTHFREINAIDKNRSLTKQIFLAPKILLQNKDINISLGSELGFF